MTFFSIFLLIDHIGIISVIISAINPLMWTILGDYKSSNVDLFGSHKSSNVDHLLAAINPLMRIIFEILFEILHVWSPWVWDISPVRRITRGTLTGGAPISFRISRPLLSLLHLLSERIHLPEEFFNIWYCGGSMRDSNTWDYAADAK